MNEQAVYRATFTGARKRTSLEFWASSQQEANDSAKAFEGLGKNGALIEVQSMRVLTSLKKSYLWNAN